MENARVVIIEDHERSLQAARNSVESSGHAVSATADNLLNALSLVDDIKDGKIPCDVVVLKANISTDNSDGEDGLTIAERIRRYNLAVYIIGNSSSMMDSFGIHVDVDPGKHRVNELGKIISAL